MHLSVKKTKLASFGTLKSGPKLFNVSVLEEQIIIIYFNSKDNSVIIKFLVKEDDALKFLEENL